MKSVLRKVNDHGVHYEALMISCPGCIEMYGGDGLHMLPVNSPQHEPMWIFDGNLEAPTLSPSLLSWGYTTAQRCHSFLRNGVFEFLSDCTHSLAGQSVPMPELPRWVEEDE